MNDRPHVDEQSWPENRTRTLALSLLATLGSGLLYPLAFPPYRLWPVAWIALVPFLVAIRRAPRRTAPLLGWLWPVVCCATLISWLPFAMARYYDQPLGVGIAAFLAVSTLTAGLEFMVFAVVFRRLQGFTSWADPLITAAAWVAAELGRAKLFTGNTWAFVGYSQVPVLPLLQIADVTGSYGVSFVVVAANAAVANLLSTREGSREWRDLLRGGVLVAFVVVLTLLYGWLRLAGSERSGPSRRTAVAVVQGNVEILTLWDPARSGEHLMKYLDLSREEIQRSRPAVLFWPENAMNFFVEKDAGYRRAIATLLSRSDAELVAGGPHAEGAGSGPPFYNSAFLLNRDGAVRARQDKRFLIPFAEYFPFAGTALVRRGFGSVREFSHGTMRPPLPTVAGAAGVLICHESLYPEAARAQVEMGAEYLVNISNDSWHGGEKYSLAAFDVAVLRAIEQRRWLVRASTAGPSGVIDAWGRVVKQTSPSIESTLTAELVSRDGKTPYQRWGDWFAFANLGIVAAVLVRGTRAGPASSK